MLKWSSGFLSFSDLLLLLRPFDLGLDLLPLYSLSFLWDIFLCFFPITKEYHRSKDWRDRSQIDKVDRDVTRRRAQAQMISNFSEVWSTLQFVTWPTVSFPGPLRDIVYLCTAHATLTALRTEDIWPFFCFSCPFMSFEAQRKSKYAKLLQFSVANFQLWGPCRHFLIEWPLFVAISFGRCHYFLAHVAYRNLPWKGLKRAEESSPLVHKDVCYLKLQIVT